jgi:hypothetical protein
MEYLVTITTRVPDGTPTGPGRNCPRTAETTRRTARGSSVWGHPPWMSRGYRHAGSVSEQVAG